eukprot:m.230660 g.230660  ORF g.230660 m.230660 type:complete len:589 (-) comp10868_c0_seq35:168-1934(-)
MDFSDITRYAPSTELRRSEDDMPAGSSKRKRDIDDIGEGRAGGPAPAGPAIPENLYDEDTGIDEAERDRILAMLEADNAPLVEFDRTALRRQVLALESKVSKNTEMRAKYPNEPNRFVDSELDLHGELQNLHAAATAPQLYPDLIRLKTVDTLIGLLAHENTDIVIGVIDLINELTNEDVDGGEDSEALIDALLEGDFLAVMMSAIHRFNEDQKDDANGVHHALGILENMLEIKPAVATSLLACEAFLHWILRRIQSRQFDANQLYCSELLAIIAQGATESRKTLVENQAIDLILRSLARYRNTNPETEEETEFMENLFDILCSLLLEENGDASFVEAEGVQLMIIMLQAKKASRRNALKVLSHAMPTKAGTLMCKTFVEHLGLKSIFPAFMKTPSNKLRKANLSETEYEEHVCTIIAALLRHLEGNDRDRVLAKFVEANFAKVDRLAELHMAYEKKVKETETLMREQLQDDEMDEETENELYMARIDSGLFALQTIDYIFAEVVVGCGEIIADRMEQALQVHGSSVANIKRILKGARGRAASVHIRGGGMFLRAFFGVFFGGTDYTLWFGLCRVRGQCCRRWLASEA